MVEYWTGAISANAAQSKLNVFSAETKDFFVSSVLIKINDKEFYYGPHC